MWSIYHNLRLVGYMPSAISLLNAPVIRGEPNLILIRPRVLISRPVVDYRRGRTTPYGVRVAILLLNLYCGRLYEWVGSDRSRWSVLLRGCNIVLLCTHLPCQTTDCINWGERSESFPIVMNVEMHGHNEAQTRHRPQALGTAAVGQSS